MSRVLTSGNLLLAIIVIVVVIVAIFGVYSFFSDYAYSPRQSLTAINSDISPHMAAAVDWEDHRGNQWSWHIEVEGLRSEYYQNLPTKPKPEENLSRYVTFNDDLIEEMAQIIRNIYPEPMNMVNFALSFVQSGFAYTPENGDHWKYPAETIVQSGDCEDKAFLFASIVKAAGHDVVLVDYEEHVLVGVQVWDNFEKDMNGTSTFEFGGNRYFYCETAYEGWQLGRFPEKYKGEPKVISPVRTDNIGFSENWLSKEKGTGLIKNVDYTL